MGTVRSRVDDKYGTVATLLVASTSQHHCLCTEPRGKKGTKRSNAIATRQKKNFQFIVKGLRMLFLVSCRFPESRSQGAMAAKREQRHAESLISLSSQAHSRICSTALSPRTFISPVVCYSVFA
jgi:hypothetical protein